MNQSVFLIILKIVSPISRDVARFLGRTYNFCHEPAIQIVSSFLDRRARGRADPAPDPTAKKGKPPTAILATNATRTCCHDGCAWEGQQSVHHHRTLKQATIFWSFLIQVGPIMLLIRHHPFTRVFWIASFGRDKTVSIWWGIYFCNGVGHCDGKRDNQKQQQQQDRSERVSQST
jgi:hypothetical protein